MNGDMIEAAVAGMHARVMEHGAHSVVTIVTGNEDGAANKYVRMDGNTYANLGAMLDQVDVLREQTRLHVGREEDEGHD